MNLGFTVETHNFYGLQVIDAYAGPTRAMNADANIARLSQGRKLICCFDTGANCTTINRKTAQELNLIAEPDSANVKIVSANAITDSSTYKIDILLPNEVLIVKHDVGVVDSLIDILIGMDLIGAGDFAITTKDKKCIMSFIVPHQNTVDFLSPT